MKKFDPSILLGRIDGDQEIFQEIMEVFVEDVPNQIDTLKRALAEKDIGLLEKQAHTLKGASGNVGAMAIQDLAQKMEHIGKKGDLSEMDRLDISIQTIEQEFEQIKQIIQTSGTGS